ncbi:MAG: TRAP transporter small permease subunit [Candidatus Thioglobus sp.]|jgi:TRAP-type C4-dicarboxylate transport system permease small subunit|nr:TRAP transporter small permease subunit [Candidatus Pseudothioglobus aerophilus]|tara:strand:- start:3021 stop:3503 length:483 start_codon:yes stop_codon:yes gene_type:complete
MVKKIADISAIVACIILFILAMLTFFDVIGRRFFNSPITGTIEIVQIGMALVAFLSMPRAFYFNAHVSADFIDGIPIKSFQYFLLFFKFLLMFSMMSLMSYAALLSANSFLKDGRTTLELDLSFYPFFYIISFGLFLSIITIIFWFLNTFSEKKTEWGNL